MKPNYRSSAASIFEELNCKISASLRIVTLILGTALWAAFAESAEDESPTVIHLYNKQDKHQVRAKLVGKKVAVVGNAQNAKEGAALVGPRGIIFVLSLESWPRELYGKDVIVTGTLISKTWKPHPPTGVPPATPVGTWYYIAHYQVRGLKKE